MQGIKINGFFTSTKASKIQEKSCRCLLHVYFTIFCIHDDVQKSWKIYINRIPKSISSHQSFLFLCRAFVRLLRTTHAIRHSKLFREAKNWSFLKRRQVSPAFQVSTEVCMRLSFVVEDTHYTGLYTMPNAYWFGRA